MYNDKKAYRSRYTKWLCMKTTAARSAASSSSRVTILLPARNAAHPITGRATGSWGTAPTRHYTVMDMPLPRRIRLRSKNQSAPADDTHTAAPEQKKRNAWPAMRSWTETPSFAPTAALDNRGRRKISPAYPAGYDTGSQPIPSTIEGEAAADVAAVVRTNTGYFLSRFRRNKKVGWNWAAFLFGTYYLFFRKMYKEGTAALAIRFAASLIVQGSLRQPICQTHRLYEHQLHCPYAGAKYNRTQRWWSPYTRL